MYAVLLTAIPVLALLLTPWLWFKLSRGARLTAVIPGPKPQPLIGNVLEFGQGTVEIIANLIRLWKQYGSVFRIWLGPKLFVALADPKYAEVILGSNTQINKNFNYRFLEPWLGTGLLTSKGAKWRNHRKILTPTFHFKILEEFVDVFNRNGAILVAKLQKEVNGPAFNIYNYITLCALDIICESAMGVSVNAQDNSQSDYIVAVKSLADVVTNRMFLPWLYPEFIFNRTDLGRQQRKYLAVLHDTTRRVIKTRHQELLKEMEIKSKLDTKEEEQSDIGKKKRLAFLDLLLQYSHEGANLTDDEIAEEVDTFMFEGHDTTASGITFTLWLLATHPDIQDKAAAELKEVFGSSDRPATFRDIQELKYLERVIKESLRLYPSVPIIARELDQDLQLPSCLVPAGTSIVVLMYMMHRDPKYFPDPEKFDPDRFLPENAQGRHPYAYVPFSAGPRNCIGQKYAMMEMKSTVSTILRRYKLLPADHKIVLSMELILRSDSGVKVQLVPRAL